MILFYSFSTVCLVFCFHFYCESGDTALLVAVCHGRCNACETLLGLKPALVNVRNERTGLSPLMESARYGFADVSSLLVNHGADTNYSHSRPGMTKGLTAFLVACLYGKLGVAHCLVGYPGADVNEGLRLAATFEHISVVKFLIENFAQVLSQRIFFVCFSRVVQTKWFVCSSAFLWRRDPFSVKI